MYTIFLVNQDLMLTEGGSGEDFSATCSCITICYECTETELRRTQHTFILHTVILLPFFYFSLPPLLNLFLFLSNWPRTPTSQVKIAKVLLCSSTPPVLKSSSPSALHISRESGLCE